MLTVTIRFFAELNDFLPPERQQQPVRVQFDVPPSVKDVIEALGVPHPEVALLLANGVPVGFDYLVQPDDYLTVYPPFRTVDVTELSRVLPPRLTEIRFVLDVHLGRLARYLRMLGFDTRYRNNFDDAELARIAHTEQRILLTRDRGLLKRNAVRYGYCLRTTQPRQQLAEVAARFQLGQTAKPFQRCIRCNGLLETVAKQAIAPHLNAHTLAEFNTFQQCRTCGQIYWPGSHYLRMRQFVAQVVPDVTLPPWPVSPQ